MSSQDDWLVDPKSNRFIDTYMRGYLDMSGGHLILRNNNIHVNDGDISLNGKLLVNSDTSLNSKLFVGNDVCMNELLMVGNDVSLNSKLFVGNDVCMNELLMVGNDVSLNSKLFVMSDVSMNETLHVGNNVTFDSKLLVEGDSSFNSNVDISGNLVIRGTLGVYQQQEIKVINTTVNNYQLIITEDISLNGNLYVKDDVSLNSKLFVAEDVCFNEVLMVGNDVSFNSDLFVDGDLSLNGDLSVGGDTQLNNLYVRGWSVLRSTLDVSKNVTFGSMLDVSGATNVRSTLDVSGVTNLASTLKVANAATLSSTLAVSGASTIGSTLNVNDTLTVSKASMLNSTLNVANAATLSSTLMVSNAATLGSTLTVTDSATIGNTLKVNDTLTVSKASMLNSTLNVANASTLKSTLMVSNAATLGSTLAVTDSATIGNTLKVNNTLTVSKASTLSSTLDVDKASTLKSTLNVSKAAKFSSTLYVAGDVSMDTVVTIGGDVSLNNKMYVAGDVSMDTVVTIGGNVTMNSKLTVYDDVTVENGGITTNDVSFNVENLPFYATGDFTDNQKIIYSKFSNSDRVLNGLYDISASSVNGTNHPWNVATNSTGTVWESANGTGTNSSTNVTYIDNDVNTSVNGEYIQFTFPFHIKLNQYVINTNNSVKDVRLIGFKDSDFYHINTFINGTKGGTGESDTILLDTSFYSNQFRVVFPQNSDNTSTISIISLSFNGDVIGSKVNIDNGNIGIGNVNPRSALEITGNMVLSNATSGINNSVENQEHGRITWAGIGHNISDNPSSYIRSYFEPNTRDTNGNLAFGTCYDTTDDLDDNQNNNKDRYIIHSTGKNEFITDVSMNSILMVGGDVSLNSNLYVSGAATMGNTLNVNDTLTVSNASILSSTLSVSNASNLRSTLNVSKAAVLSSTLDVTGGATMGNKLFVNDTLTVNNASTLKSTLSVSKAATLNSTLEVTGHSTMGSSLKVNDTLVVSKSSTLSSTLSVSNAVTLSSTLNVVGESTMNTLSASSASISSILEVVGDVSINSLSANHKITATDLSINNNIAIHNNAVIGHADISDNNVLTVIGKVVATDFIIQSGEGGSIQLITSKVGTVQLGPSTVSPPKITTDTNEDTSIVIQTGNSDRFIIDEYGNTTFINDVSINAGLEVGGTLVNNSDVSMNAGLVVGGKLVNNSDVSMNAGLVVGGKFVNNSDVSMNAGLVIGGKLVNNSDVSMNAGLVVGGKLVNDSDVSMNAGLVVGGKLVNNDDVSMNAGLNVGGDVSLNSNVTINGDLQIYGKLDVNQIQNTNTMNTTVNEYTLVVTEDLSINGGLSVSEDLSLNGNANISNKIIVDKDGDVTVTNKNIVIGNSIYLSSVIGGGVFDNITEGRNSYTESFAGFNYTILASSYNSNSNFFSVASAFVNNNNMWNSNLNRYIDDGTTQLIASTNPDTTSYFPSKTSINEINQSISINGEYIETTLPYTTTIDGFDIHTNTYQVPTLGVLLGNVVNNNGNDVWVKLIDYNKTNITDVSQLRDTEFKFSIPVNNQFETTKIRFVINKINKATSITETIEDSFGNQIDIYNKNVSVRYINFSGLVQNAGISIGAGYSQNSANTSVGFATLAKNQTGKNNIAFGNYALSQTTNNDNVAVGYNSLIANTDGSSNIGVGSDTLLNNSIGSNNIALGTNSGSSNDRGTNNTFIGTNSGYSNRDGNYNTFVGYNTDINGNHSHSTAIGADAKITEDNQIVIGTTADNVKIPGTIELSGTFSGDISFNDNIRVSGSTILQSTLNVTNATTLNNTLNVTGKSTLNTLDVNGITTFKSNVVVSSGNALTSDTTIINGKATLKNTLSVANATTLSNMLYVAKSTTLISTLNVKESTTLQSRLDVGGDVSLNQDLTVQNLDVTGNTLASTLTTSGSTTINGKLTVAPNQDINLVNKLTINNDANVTTITDDTINISNSVTDFITIKNNKITITGATNNTEVMDVTGVISANSVLLKAGGSVTTTGDTASTSTSTIVGDASNGMGIYPLSTNPFAGIKFEPFVNESRTNSVAFSVNNSGDTNIVGDLTVDNSLNVTGKSNLSNLETIGDTYLNNLHVTNATTLNSSLNVTHATTLASSLNVTGTTTLSDVTVTDETTLSSTLNVTDATTLSSTLTVTGSSIFNDTLTVSKETTLNSNIDICGNLSVSNGEFTINDISFGVTNLPTSITGLFNNSNQKIIYSQYSDSERVFNGLYDISASSIQSDNHPWKLFDSNTSSFWQSATNTGKSSNTDVRYIDSNGDIQGVSGEYVQVTFPFYINLKETIINAADTINIPIIIAGKIDNSFNYLGQTNNAIDPGQQGTNTITTTNGFYSNTFKLIIPENVDNSAEIKLAELSFDGDVLGSKVHIDNGSIGVGTTVPRSALEVTGDMVISKSINGENTSGDSVEHGRIVWAGIGRDISNSNHSSYIRSYFEDGTYDTSGNLAFGTSDGTTVANDRFVINANGINNFITDVSMDSNLAINGDASFNSNLYVKEKVWVDGTVGIGTASPVVVLDISDTGALRIPVGESNKRPVDITGGTDNISYYGSIRYNTENTEFEGYGPGGTWNALAGVSNISKNTKITAAEPTAADTNNQLKFYTSEGTIEGESLLRMIIDNTGDISMNHKLFVNDTLNVSNTSLLKSTLNVSKAATLSSTLDVAGASTLKSTLTVSKAATLSSTLDVTGASTLKSTLNVTGKSTFKTDISMNGHVDISGDLIIKGNLSVYQYDNVKKINTTVNDYTLIVTEDISLNGSLIVSDNVGIGTTDPSANLHIHQPLDSTREYAGKVMFSTNNAGNQHWQMASIGSYINTSGSTINDGYPGGLIFSTKPADFTYTSLPVERMVIDTNGNVGIGTTNPGSYRLNVNGDVNATSYNASSDYRIKENVVPISDTSYNIDNIRPVTYTNTKMEKQDFGVIAHELQEQIPFLVNGEKDGEHHQSVNYNGLIGLLLNEVQQLKKRVQELEQSKP